MMLPLPLYKELVPFQNRDIKKITIYVYPEDIFRNKDIIYISRSVIGDVSRAMAAQYGDTSDTVTVVHD